MNDEFTSLENELRGLEPRAPGKQLEERIERLLAQPSLERDPTTWWQRLGFNRPFAAFSWGIVSPALTAAIVIAATHFVGPERPPSPRTMEVSTGTGESAIRLPDSPSNGFAQASVPATAKATNVVYQRSDEGVVLDSRQEPVHRLRYRSAGLVEWHNPGTGANWQVSYPREDVVLVPVQVD